MYVKKVGGSASLGSGDGITFAYSLFTTDYNHYFRGDTTSKNLDAYIARDVALVETELIFMLQCWRDGTKFDNYKFQIEVVEGTTAPTTYAPYTGQTATLTLPHTIYGGTVDAVTGEGVLTKSTLNFTINSLDMVNMSASAGKPWVSVYKVCDFNGMAHNPKNEICNIFTWVDWDYIGLTSIDTCVMWGANTTFGIALNKAHIGLTDESTDDEVIEAAMNFIESLPTPIQIAYKLAEPVPVTAAGAQPIPALSGVNTVITDAGSVTVTGRADPIKRITDLEDAVASMTTT